MIWNRPRFTFLLFFIPFILLILIYLSAYSVSQQVLEIRRRSLAVVSDWYLLHQLTERRYQLRDRNLEVSDIVWHESLKNFENSLYALDQADYRWALTTGTNQEIDTSLKVWDFARSGIVDAESSYQELITTPFGKELSEASYIRLVESAFTETDMPQFDSRFLRLFYQLQDRLTLLEATGTTLTDHLELIQNSVEHRIYTLNLVVLSTALILTVMVVGGSVRMFMVTNAEREQHINTIEERNRALRESEEQYRLLFELESDAIFLIDNISGNILAANNSASELYGYSHDDLLKMRNTDLSVEQEESQHVNENWQDDQDPIVYIPIRYHRKQNGEVFPVEITGRFFERNGRPFHIAAVRDITLRQQTQDELVAREAKLASIFRVAPVGIGVTVNRVMIEVNETLCMMLGYSRQELVGENARMLYPSQEDYEYVGQVKYDQIRQQGTGVVETRWQHKGGRILRIILGSTPIDPQDWSQGITFTALDITRREEDRDKLRAKTEELDLFFSAALDLLAIADVHGYFRRLNPQWEETLGYSLDELVGSRFLDLVHPDDMQATLLAVEKLGHHESVLDFVNRYRHKDGNYRWFEWRSYASGEVIYAAARDITQRIQTEQIMSELNQRLERELRFTEALLSALPIPVFFKDADGIYLGCNKAFSDAVGYTSDELKGKTVFDIWPHELAQVYYDQDLEMLENPTHQAYETKVQTKNGEVRDAFFTKDVFYDENGAVVGIVGAYMDVTERNQAIKALEVSRETERQFSLRVTQLVSVINTLHQADNLDDLCRMAITLGTQKLGFGRLGLWFFDRESNLIWGSFGIDENGQLRDERDISLPLKPGEAADIMMASEPKHLFVEETEIFDEYARTLADGQRLICGLWDGKQVIGSLSTDNLLDGKGFSKLDREILQLYSTSLGHLISLKRVQAEMEEFTAQLETRVNERTAQLQTANKELEAFSYSVSHDLRAPLRAVDGFSKVLIEDYADRLDDAGRGHLERVRTAAQHMGDLIDDLLNLSRLSRAHMSPAQINLSNIVLDIQQELLESQPDRDVKFMIAPDLVAYADYNLIRIALDNLFRNAWKFTTKKPSARIEFGQIKKDGETTFFVRDNGAGFDMQYVEKLFGVFQRLHSPGEFEGTGIGLTIVQRIISRHGGRVWADGAISEGACFYFTLPDAPKVVRKPTTSGLRRMPPEIVDPPTELPTE